MPDPAVNNRSDAQLLSDIQAGESAAFDILYMRHRQWAYRLAYRFTGHDADAWDVVQEAFLYLAQKAPVLRASLRTLLFTVIRNCAMKANAKRRKLVSGDELLAAVPATPDSARPDDLLELLQLLDLPHRQVVILRYVDSLSLEEIAAVLQIPEGTAKSRLFHAHRTLRENPRFRRHFQA